MSKSKKVFFRPTVFNGLALPDQHPDISGQRKIAITEDNSLLSVEFEGYNNCGTCDSEKFGKGSQTIVSFEVWEDELRCLIWADINQEDPTHIISLDGAKITKRVCDYCGGDCPAHVDDACEGFIGDPDNYYFRRPIDG